MCVAGPCSCSVCSQAKGSRRCILQVGQRPRYSPRPPNGGGGAKQWRPQLLQSSWSFWGGSLSFLAYSSLSFSSLSSDPVPPALCCPAGVMATRICEFLILLVGGGQHLGRLLELLRKCLHEMYLPWYSTRLCMNPALKLYENGSLRLGHSKESNPNSPND